MSSTSLVTEVRICSSVLVESTSLTAFLAAAVSATEDRNSSAAGISWRRAIPRVVRDSMLMTLE